jgi:signal transduction histidine kinase/ActR/RegA family two-component response regulator
MSSVSENDSVGELVPVVAWHNSARFVRATAAQTINWFIPDSLSLDVEARRRVLMFLVSHLLGPWLGFTVIGFLYLVDPHPGIALWVSSIAIAGFWLFPFVLRFTGKLSSLALLSVQNVAFVVLLLSYYYGGLSSPFLPWLITVPMLAFFYLGENAFLRGYVLAGLTADILVFFAIHLATGRFPHRVPLEELSTVGLVSVFCAGLYVTMMAFYYARIVASHSELEREVQHHKQTAVLLVEARDASEGANRAKSEFLATMSHELRTPLNAVIGFSETMVTELFGPLGHEKYKDYAKDIQDSGTHLLEIINDILDLSKAEAGAIELEEDLLDCGDIIASLCRLFRPRLQKSNLKLHLHLPKRLPRLQADARRFKQIVLNVITNAIKFTPGGGRIEVNIFADPIQGLIISVQDSGIGIAEADLNRVRKPFVQIDSALNRRHEGTGLGLPLVEMMIRQHGGRLVLTSALGKGTSVRLFFPVERLVWSRARKTAAVGGIEAAGSCNSSVANSPTAMEKRPAESFEVPRILVVEDDKDLCDLLRRMLHRTGFITLAANNGREALRVLATQSVDLVITDMVMPELDGVELMRTLHNDQPNLPIIAISGVDDFKEYQRISTNLGAQAALQKPVSQAKLVSAVNQVLGERIAGRTAVDYLATG